MRFIPKKKFFVTMGIFAHALSINQNGNATRKNAIIFQTDFCVYNLCSFAAQNV